MQLRICTHESSHNVHRKHQSRTSVLRRGVTSPDLGWEASSSIIATCQISFEYACQTWKFAADVLSLMSLRHRQAFSDMLVYASRHRNISGQTEKGFDKYHWDVARLRLRFYVDWRHRLDDASASIGWDTNTNRASQSSRLGLGAIGNLSVEFPFNGFESSQTCKVHPSVAFSQPRRHSTSSPVNYINNLVM